MLLVRSFRNLLGHRVAVVRKGAKRWRAEDRIVAAMVREAILGAGDQTTEQCELALERQHGLVVETRFRSLLANGVRLGLIERTAAGMWRAV